MLCYNVLAASCVFRFIFIIFIVPCFHYFYAIEVEHCHSCAFIVSFCFAAFVMSIVTVVNVLLVIVNIYMSARRSYETNEFKDKLRKINKKELLVIVFFIILFLLFLFPKHESVFSRFFLLPILIILLNISLLKITIYKNEKAQYRNAPTKSNISKSTTL